MKYEFFGRVVEVVNQLKTCGEEIDDKKIVEKFLNNLTEKFDAMVVVIEQTKDTSKLSVEEVMGSLKSFEQRLSRRSKRPIEIEFQFKLTLDVKTQDKGLSIHENQRTWSPRGRGRSNYDSRPTPDDPPRRCNIPWHSWFEGGRSKTYTPSADDIGHVPNFECVVIDAESKLPVGHASTLLTSRVIPAPSPTPRRLVPVSGVDVMGHLDSDARISSTFCLMFTPPASRTVTALHGLSLGNIVGRICYVRLLATVQTLSAFKRFKIYSGNTHTIDGCAAFFLEFNKAAQSLTDAVVPSAQRKTALNRLDNVALIVVLEAKFSNQGDENPGKRQLLCFANTHVNVHQDLRDVKLGQVLTLLKGLEKIAASADIPMLVCGDFNSVPQSAPHSLLAMGKVDPLHPDLVVDPLGILRPHSKLTHQLPLDSAYSSFARTGLGLGLEQQRRRMDPTTNEPLFTNCTRDFIGTLDYIFYTADSLTVESLLELLDEDSLRKDTALPSPEWSSDHLALLAEFRCKPRPRR